MVSPTLSCCEHSLNTMRYADRVKELGGSDPSSGGQDGQRQAGDGEGNGHMMDSEETLAMRNDGVLSPEDSDLAQLRSLNEGELSADWYNFQVFTLLVVLGKFGSIQIIGEYISHRFVAGFVRSEIPTV